MSLASSGVGAKTGARFGALALFAISCTGLCVGTDGSAIHVYDEGDVLYGAQRVLHGAVPYRDFWAIYGPAQYWLVAALFKLFGTSILAERLWDALVRAALATTTYSLSRRLSGQGVALAVWALTLGWLWLVKFYGYPLLPAALFGLLAVAALLGPAAERAPRRTTLIAGALAGAAALFRPDIGAYTVLATTLWIAMDPSTGLLGNSGLPDGRAPLHQKIEKVTILIAGAAVVTLPAIVYLILRVPLADLLRPLLVYPATIYPRTRNLPFPSVVAPVAALLVGDDIRLALDQISRALALYFPWLIGGLAFFRLWRERGPQRLQDGGQPSRAAVLLLLLLVLFYGVKGTVRPHVPHVAHVLPPALALAGMLLVSGDRGGRRLWSLPVLGLLGALAYSPVHSLFATAPGSLLGARLLGGSIAPASTSSSPWDPRAAAPFEPPSSAVYFRLDPDQLAAVGYIRSHTSATDKLFVGNGRHDVAFANDVLFYFLADRASSTQHHEFNPGVTTTAEIQAAIIASLRAQTVPYVVRTDRFDQVREPNLSAVSSGVHDLDRFLELHYVPVARVGRYEIARRRDGVR